MISLLKEVWTYGKDRPFIALLMMALALFGGLLMLASGTAIAPFIYTLF